MDLPERNYYRITFPDDLQPAAVHNFVATLGNLAQPSLFGMSNNAAAIVIEVWGDTDGIHHRIGIPVNYSHLINQLRAHASGATIENDDGLPLAKFTLAQEYGLSSTDMPLHIDPEATAVTILSSLQPLDPDELVAFQWIISPYTKSKPRPKAPVRGMGIGHLPYGKNVGTALLATAWNISSGVTKGVTDVVSNQLNKHQEVRQAQIDQKWQGFMFKAICRIGVSASYTKTPQLHKQLYDALKSRTSQANFIKKGLWSDKRTKESMEFGLVPTVHWPCLLNAEELSALLAFPVGEATNRIPGLYTSSSYQAPPSSSIPIDGRVLANSTYGGKDRALAIPWSETIRHLYVLGPIGSGKTTLLENAALQDIAHGAGLLYIDAKGDSATRLIDCIPTHRIKDVIYFDPSNRNYVVGLNLLSGSTHNPGLATDNILGMFKKLYQDSWGQRLEYNLRGAIRTLAEVQYMTLLEVSELLTNDTFRAQLLKNVHVSPTLQDFWNQYDSMTTKQRADTLAPIMNKLQSFGLRDEVRHIVGQSVGLDLDKAIKDKKIIIANLDKGKLGKDNTPFIGSILVNLLWEAVLRRPIKDRTIPYYAYIDECQLFLNTSTPIDDILATSRGYGLGIVLANQFLGQLNEKDKSYAPNILTNCRSSAFFKLEADDAKEISKKFDKMEAKDFLNIGHRQVIVSISTGSPQPSKPVTGYTYPPTQKTGSAEAVITNTINTYAYPTHQVDDDILRRRQAYSNRPYTKSRPIDVDDS